MKVRILYESAFLGAGLPIDKDVVELPEAQAKAFIEVGYAEEVVSKAVKAKEGAETAAKRPARKKAE